MLANQREIKMLERVEALERAVFGEDRSIIPTAPSAPVDRAAAVRADAQRLRRMKAAEADPKPGDSGDVAPPDHDYPPVGNESEPEPIGSSTNTDPDSSSSDPSQEPLGTDQTRSKPSDGETPTPEPDPGSAPSSTPTPKADG